MENPENLDELQFKKEKQIGKILDSNESILLTTKIFKYNRKNKRQERNFMVTNKYVYNLSKTSLKRKIEITKIDAITVSTSSTEFVLHINDEYDYRYAAITKKENVIQLIVQNYYQNSKQPLLLFQKKEASLEQWTTTKDDKKKKLSRFPTEGGVQVTPQQYAKLTGTGGQTKGGDQGETRQLYGKEKVTIDDFNLIKVVGRGAFGKVMLVEKKDTKKIYALKSIRKEDIIDKDQIEHTKTERVILEHCNNNFLVNLIYAFTTPEKIFFVTQFMKGGELFQHLRHAKRFTEDRAKFYTAEIALALAHLHSQNIIYRDLKPENILMDEQGHICLTDFGMAKIMRKGELAMSFCGTPEYLSPEIILGTGHSSSADWWALGIFTFEMMYALPPFYSENQNEMFEAIQHNYVKFPNYTKVSDEGKDFILRLTEKDPKKRLGSKYGIEEIKSHPWFADINWSKLAKKEVPPPFKPDLKEWEQNFDENFISEDPINSYVPTTNEVQEYQDEFQDFSYVPGLKPK